MSAILNVLSGTKNDIRDKKRYQGQKTISGTKNDIRVTYRFYACPPIINLIKAQVCDKMFYEEYPIYPYNHIQFSLNHIRQSPGRIVAQASGIE